jgi:phosphate-selective porin OprO and OprP
MLRSSVCRGMLMTSYALALSVVAASVAPATARADDLNLSFDNGLRMKSEDGAIALKMGGRIFFDWVYFSEDDDYLRTMDPVEDGSEFRSTRLYVSGTIYENVEFKAQYDFASGSVNFKDVYVGLKRIPGTGIGLRAGHFKQPFGLSELTSSKYIWFMERPSTMAFAPGRKSGLMLHDSFAGKRGSWAASVYRNSDSQGKAQDDGEFNTAARLTFAVWEGENGNVVHFGASATRRSDSTNQAEFELEPEAHLVRTFDSIPVPAETWDMFDLEFGASIDRFSAQGEFLSATTSAPAGSEDASFSSYYAQGSVFLTGEHRPYKKGAATFSRVSPKETATADSGTGAVEFVARYSRTDLQDGPTYDAGTLDGLSFGLNWYMNPNSRIMMNVVHSEGDTPDVKGTVTAFMSRFQVDF